MSEWICEVLSYAAMASYDQPITAGDGLKRVFSVLSSGVAINGIKDPTNENKNIFESFTKQELLKIIRKNNLRQVCLVLCRWKYNILSI